MGESHSVDYSEEFYKRHSQRYSEVSHQLLQSVYGWPSHPALKTDMNLLEWLRAFETAKNELDPSDKVIAVLAGIGESSKSHSTPKSMKDMCRLGKFPMLTKLRNWDGTMAIKS